MTNKQCFLNNMEYKKADYVPNWELGVWGQTVDRWKEEGLDVDKLHWDWFAGEEYFGMDYREFVDVNGGLVPPFKQEVMEETERHVIYRDLNGVLRKTLKVGKARGTSMSMDQFLKFPVESREDFTELQDRLQTVIDKRYPKNWEEKVHDWNNSDDVLILGKNCSFGGFYWRAREWMGTENLSIAWYDMPDLMHEMMEYIGDFIIEVTTPIVKRVDFDYFNLNEDMAMKTAPLLSPATFKEFIYPHLKRVISHLKANGVKYISVDSDGNSEPLIPLLMEAGVDVLWPLERASGMDPLMIREKYGRELRLWGGVDKRELSKDKESIKKHMEYLAPLVEEGGFIPSVDHTVPPDISLENFKYYMDVKKSILGK